ncbi:Calcium-responsive transcription factor [Trinorchestia longiramus]|nr:Calcium-responsive transcription factor [Trinorchestia longiramus]
MEIRVLESFESVRQCIQDYEQQSFTHFVTYNKSPLFGKEEFVPDANKCRLHFWSHCGKMGVPIRYDGVPFVHVGRWSLVCHQGRDTGLRRKTKYIEERRKKTELTGTAPTVRKTSTKKVNCPAQIYVSHIVKYPQFKVPEQFLTENSLPTEQLRRVMKRKIRTKHKYNRLTMERLHRYYVRLPSSTDHQGHPLVSRSTDDHLQGPRDIISNSSTLDRRNVNKNRDRHRRTKEPIDDRVSKKLRELVSLGYTSTAVIRAELNKFVIKELFVGQQPPPAMFRRFNPTSRDILNALHRVKQDAAQQRRSCLLSLCESIMTSISESLETLDDESLSSACEQLHSVAEQLKNKSQPKQDCSVSVHPQLPAEEASSPFSFVTVIEENQAPHEEFLCADLKQELNSSDSEDIAYKYGVEE